MLLKSIALEKLLIELSDPTKIGAFQAAEAGPVREALLRRSLLFGKLRWLSKRNGWNFDFDQLSPFRFGDTVNWTVDEPAVLAFLANAVGMTAPQLATNLAALNVVDPYKVIHGKDTLAVLAMGLRSKLGNNQHPVERLCQMLRLAFDNSLANATLLLQGIRAWETNNSPYRVLA